MRAMAPEVQQQRLDEAFDRIEETILPCITMMIETLLEASELGEAEVSPQAYAAELRTLALQLEALTREIEKVSPANLTPGVYRSVSAA